MKWVNALNPAFGAVHMQSPMLEVHLCPAKLTEFCCSKPMPIRKQDRCAVPGTIAPTFARSIAQLLYLALSQVLTLPIR